MQLSEFYQSLAIDKSPIEAVRFNPYYQRWSGLRRGRPSVGGNHCFDLASNDYLGLASDERIQEAMIAAVREYGSSMCGTPIASGYADILADLESELARFVGLEAALVFPSCYQANLALFAAVVGAADVILVDHYAHASLGYGIKAAGCKVKPFLHNDMEHLERLLAASGHFRQIFVVTESVFSTEGAVAPLGGIVELCRRYNAVPVVDDSHGIGVLGKGGRGILEDKAIADYPGIYTASLGKALGNLGGMIAGKKTVIEALRYCCPGLIYSTALPPVCIAGVRCALSIVGSEFDRLGRAMWENHQLLLEALARRGFELSLGRAPIAAIQGGSTEKTLTLARQFFEHHILSTPFVPPSVPEGKGTLRLILGAKLDRLGVERLFEALPGLGTNPEVKPAEARLRTDDSGQVSAPLTAGRVHRSAGAHRAWHCLIVNRQARSGRTTRTLAQLRSELQRHGMKYSWVFCEGLEHARMLSQEANRSGYDVVVAVGGDGTINRVLNGFFDSAGHRLSSTRLGVVHIGTSPDFCRSYRVPRDVPGAVRTLVNGASLPISVGKIVYQTNSTSSESALTTAFFGCCANLGLGASLARLANGGIRRYLGDFPGTFVCLLRLLLQSRPGTVRLELDGLERPLEKVCNIAVGKTFYVASGIKVRHQLQELDERLYAVCLRNLSWLRLGRVLIALYNGKPISAGPCLSLAYARVVRVETTGAPWEVEFDGDPAGLCPCSIETAPEPLELIIPQP